MSDGHEMHEVKSRMQNYFPLIVIILVSLIAGFVMTSNTGLTWKMWVGNFMGLFFFQLATFKFFDIRGFAEGFAMYDIPTQYYKPYAYIYPFIEFILGLLFLGHLIPVIANIITIIVMLVSFIGVLKGLMTKRRIVCACLGTVIKIPLTSLSFIENIGMAVLSIVMLIW